MDIIAEVTTETVEHKVFIVKLTEDELTKALIDPRPLQVSLRKARAAAGPKRSNWATAGYAGHAAPNKGQAAKKAAKAVRADKAATAAKADQKCPHCHYPFKRLAKHLPTCPEKPTSAQPPADE